VHPENQSNLPVYEIVHVRYEDYGFSEEEVWLLSEMPLGGAVSITDSTGQPTRYSITFRFTDATGRRWERTSGGELKEYKQNRWI
jgi:hypothetical protein